MTSPSTELDYATMLLTQRFEDAPMSEIEPITTSRYTEICQQLEARDLNVGHLLSPSHAGTIADFPDAREIDLLLARSVTLGAKTAEWTRENIHTICRSNRGYPRRLLQTMGDAAPPVVYYVGEIDLLYDVAVSIMLPSEHSAELSKYAQRLGKGFQQLGGAIATRVDHDGDIALVTSATGRDSAVIGVMDHNFIQLAQHSRIKRDINAGRILLMTPNCPDSVLPNCAETNAEGIIGSIAGRTMLVDEGPPLRWYWTDLTQRPAATSPEPGPEQA